MKSKGRSCLSSVENEIHVNLSQIPSQIECFYRKKQKVQKQTQVSLKEVHFIILHQKHFNAYIYITIQEIRHLYNFVHAKPTLSLVTQKEKLLFPKILFKIVF